MNAGPRWFRGSSTLAHCCTQNTFSVSCRTQRTDAAQPYQTHIWCKSGVKVYLLAKIHIGLRVPYLSVFNLSIPVWKGSTRTSNFGCVIGQTELRSSSAAATRLAFTPSTAAVTADGDFCPAHKRLTIWLSLCRLAPFQLKSRECKKFFYIFKCFSLCLTVASTETLKRRAFFMRWQMEIFTYLIGILKAWCGGQRRCKIGSIEQLNAGLLDLGWNRLALSCMSVGCKCRENVVPCVTRNPDLASCP